jgi:hypothetical protein
MTFEGELDVPKSMARNSPFLSSPEVRSRIRSGFVTDLMMKP